MAPRHHEFWRWIVALRPGVRPQPVVHPWPRGGAKSSTIELGVAFVGYHLTRRFAFYISATQDQANEHVQTIADHLSDLGIERYVDQYGRSRGWRANMLRAANGFNVLAIGLDGSGRGIKLAKDRPDLLIFDDFDDEADTPKTIRKKVARITKALLPTGSSDCAVAVLQNIIHRRSIMSTLVDGSADFLVNRQVYPVEPAIGDLITEIRPDASGKNVHVIVSGQPTWVGQDLATCQAQMDEWGYQAFMAESQHDVTVAEGTFFRSTQFGRYRELPPILRFVRAWDLAGTENGGDFTVGVLEGKSANGQIYVPDVQREQYSSERVKKLVFDTAKADRKKYGRVRVRLPQDPGSAGKTLAEIWVEELIALGFDAVAEPVTGRKGIRAKVWAEIVNVGNVFLPQDEDGRDLPWVADFVSEHDDFREDESHDHDDQVDAGRDALVELTNYRPEIREDIERGEPPESFRYGTPAYGAETGSSYNDHDDDPLAAYR